MDLLPKGPQAEFDADQVRLAEEVGKLEALKQLAKQNSPTYRDSVRQRVEERNLGPMDQPCGGTPEHRRRHAGRVALIVEVIGELGFGGVRQVLWPAFGVSEQAWADLHREAMAELAKRHIRPVHETKQLLMTRLEEMYEAEKNPKTRLRIMDMIARMGGSYMPDAATAEVAGEVVMPPSEIAAAMDDATLGGTDEQEVEEESD